ncbi:hypothetical protein BDP27DRAFT_1340560 [Rhodocollybia butyracea]|uniref:Nucleoplasmin-like domain-containing protein n=1 Tax=Rhodocollybia butyracea TaxID=206335 RepID=A0A9P5P6K7_9AGAR|nr:hypothetical protein BDP27DRAFT_1340560 [Rhodocollybia butyracea]
MFWNANVIAGIPASIVPPKNLLLTNVAIRGSYDSLSSTRLYLIVNREGNDASVPVTICTLSHNLSQAHIGLMLNQDIQYTVRTEGPHTVSIIGYFPGTSLSVNFGCPLMLRDFFEQMTSQSRHCESVAFPCPVMLVMILRSMLERSIWRVNVQASRASRTRSPPGLRLVSKRINLWLQKLVPIKEPLMQPLGKRRVFLG